MVVGRRMGYWRVGGCGGGVGRRMVELLCRRGIASGNRWRGGNPNPNPPPDPIPNRPLRAPRERERERERERPPPLPSSSDAGKSLLSDEAFLDKFKLGPPPLLSKDKKSEPADTGAVEEEAKEEVEVEEADAIFREMKEKGLVPNAVAMLDGLCKDGLVQEAMKLFNSMRDKGSFPDVVVYTAVVDGFCRARKLDDALRVFRKMQTNGITPNAFSYGVLVRGLSSSQSHLDDAVDFCLEMLRQGHSPNVPTLVGLVDALSRTRGVDHAHSVVSTLCQNGFLLNHKAVSDFLDKNAPTNSSLQEAIFGKRPPRRLF